MMESLEPTTEDIPPFCDRCGHEGKMVMEMEDSGDAESGPGEPYAILVCADSAACQERRKIKCKECDTNQAIKREITVNKMQDPTQAFVLKCGHIVAYCDSNEEGWY